ncbi:MAG TPA: glucokinase [Bradyrhizobium sp.]|nr:glucokinase [Bradyrhizobium sp.]
MSNSGTLTHQYVLLADIGGTNARFALADGAGIGAIAHLKVGDFPSVTEAIATFLHHRTALGKVGAAVLAVAGPVENNRSTTTNSRWLIDGEVLKTAFGFTAVRILNDFEAVAWSLPELKSQDVHPIGGGHAVAGAPMLALGPGTGFGVACLFAPDRMSFAAVSEAGHATIAAMSSREDQVIGHLRERFGHVSVERTLSGAGLENLYRALASLDGATVQGRDAPAITQAALDGSCSVSGAALDMFCSLLGSVAGSLALTFSARGGVYIAGGIVPRFADYLARSSFRKQFESKGRFESYLRDIPASIIVRSDESFVGLKAFYDRTMAGDASDAKG